MTHNKSPLKGEYLPKINFITPESVRNVFLAPVYANVKDFYVKAAVAFFSIPAFEHRIDHGL